MSDLRISWFTPNERSKLEAFYEKVWCPIAYKKDPRWLDWQILNNPNTDDKPSPLLLAWLGGEVVGHMVYIPTTLWQGGTPHQVSWCNNLYVVPEHRRKKIAVQLYDRSLELYPAILGSGQSSANHQLMLKYGWKHVSKVNQFEKLFLSFGYLGRSLGEGPVKALKRSGAMAWGLVKKRRTGALPAEEVERLSEGWDACWSRARSRLANVAQRDARTVNWRLADHPYHNHVLLVARDPGGGLKGFIGGRVSGETGRIVDFLVGDEDDEAADVLVAALEQQLRRRGAVRMASRSVCGALESALRRAGYLSTAFEQHFFLRSEGDYSLDAADWHVTAMDSDLDR